MRSFSSVLAFPGGKIETKIDEKLAKSLNL
mgnify:CR=1 FL=1